MKKKNLAYGIAVLSIFTLASCGSQSFTKDRGQVDETLPSVEIPDVLKHDALSYTVKHELENANGGYDTVYVQNLDGNKGEYTLAEALEYKGYTPLPFEQVLINDESVVVEIKYKANELKLTLQDIDSNIGYVYGGGDYYAYNNEVTLTAKPNIGYEFVGWFNGNNELSKNKTYSFTLEEDMNVYGKFKVSDEFKYFDFTSDQTSCTINDLILDAPTTLVIPEKVTKIADNAFSNAKLTNVILPTTLNEIGNEAFYRSSLLSVTINSDINIDRYSFYSCSRLYEIYNNSNLNLQIGSDDYGYVAKNALIIHSSNNESSIFTKQDDYLYAVVEDSLTLVNYDGHERNLSLPSEVTIDDKTYDSYSIATLALAKNEDLVIVTVPEAVEAIGDGAFNGCSNLYEVFNYSNLNIQSSSYDNGGIASNAVAVHTDSTEDQVVFYNDDFIYRVDENYATILKYTNKAKKNVEIGSIKDYYIIIGSESFRNNKVIESLVLGENVKEIAGSAFDSCSNLTYVEANSVKTIGFSAFQNCSNLRDISMDSVESIGNSAFLYDYSLYQVKLPESLTTINTNAFKNCYKLVYVLNKSNISIYTGSTSNGYVGYYAKEIGTNTEYFTNENGFITYLYDDQKYLVSYVGTDTDVIVPSDIYEIDMGAFYNNTNMKSVSVSSNTILNDSVFAGCKNLEYMDTPYYSNGLSYLFKYMNSSYPQEGQMPENLTSIRVTGNDVYFSSSYFEYINLETLDLACSVSSFNYMFSSLLNLKNVYYEGTLADWLEFSFSDAEDNPMYKASNFYILDEEGEITLGHNKFSTIKELVISDDVESIGNYQFYGFGIEKLVIPASVTSIGVGAFANCKELASVTLNGQEEISYSMFENCSSLRSIDLTGIKVIGNSAFANCGLKTIDLKDVESLEYSAFAGCESLLKVTLPASITVIPDSLFRNCYGLQKVEILGNVTSIGEGAFANCYLLNSINIPNSLETIGSAAFRNCETIKSISLSDTNVTDIASYLFAGCRSLVNLELGPAINSVGEHAFDNCKVALTKYEGAYYLGPEDNPYKWLVKVDKTEKTVVVNENCEIIMESAFSKCKSLKSLTVPNSITSLGQILKGNTTIEYLSVPFIGDGQSYPYMNYFFGSTYTDYTYVPASLKTVAVTGNITKISSNAFKNAAGITSVILSDSITTIEDNAFYGSGITAIDLNNVETIGTSAFNSSSLKSISITNKVTSIGNNAFSNCKQLTSVDMSNMSNTCSVGTYAFSSCSKLASVDLGNAKNISNRMFENCTLLENITIPSSITFVGQYAFHNAGLTSIDLSQMADNTTIMDYAFAECASLESAILPNITIIYSHLFYDCTSLETCAIPNSVTEIQVNAFDNTRLHSVTLPEGINKSIGSLAFGNNPNLEEVIIKCTTNAYASSNYSIFSGSNYISTVVFTEGCTTITNSLFSGRTLLSSVTLPTTLETIGQSAFYNCSSLTSITIPENVTSIGDNAFYDCTKLLEVYNLSGLTITAGSEENGKVAYYAIAVHNNASDDSIYEKDANGFTFVVKKGKGYLFAYDGTETEVTLPSSFVKNGVTYNTYDIHSNAFINNTSITSVTIPGSVTTIGESAFEGCTALTNVMIEEGVKVIEESAFYNCSALEYLSLPNSLEAIEGTVSYGNYSNLHYYCSSDGDMYLGNETNNYLVFAKVRGTYINTINIHDGCKIIAPNAACGIYYNCTVNFPEGLEYIGDYAFTDCQKTKNYSFPSTLKYIGNHAFAYNYALQAVLLADTEVEYIGGFAFCASSSNHSITAITLPDTLTEIGQYAFEYSLVTYVVIPASVKIVGDRAFYYNSNLADIEIASKDTKFYMYAFYGSPIANVYYDLTMDDWATLYFDNEEASPLINSNSVLYVKDSLGEYTYNGNTYRLVDDVVLTNNVEEIGDYAFNNLKMTSITIPATVNKIGTKAFYNCTSLVNVYYEGTIEDWVNISFKDIYSTPMSNAIYFYILDNSGSIIHNGKNYSLVTEANITSSLEKLPDYVFYGFKDLAVVSLPNTILEIGSYAFYNCRSIKNIELPNSLTTIGDYAFANCINLTDIEFPNTVIEIGSYAFSFCRCFKDITLPASLTTLGTYAFNECYNLKDITFNANLTKINDYAFSKCYNLKNVYNDGTLVNWCNIVFSNETSTPMYYASNFYLLDSEGTTTHNTKTYELLTDLTTPEEVTAIKKYSFYGFDCLNYLTIANTVTTISIYAFYDCEHLYIATLGTGLTTIGSSAFGNCYRLVEVRNGSKVSLPEPGKTSSTSGDIMRYVINTANFYNPKSLFNLDSNGHIIDENGYLFASIWGNDGYLVDYIGNETNLVLPSEFSTYSNTGLTDYRINDYAFYKNNKITSVVIPSNVKPIGSGYTFKSQIGAHAFDSCANLVSITIASNISSFGDDAFNNCDRLYEVYNLNPNLSLTMGSQYTAKYLSYRAKVIHTSLDEDSIVTVDPNGFMFMYLNETYYLIGYAGEDTNITLPSSFEFNGNTITNYELYEYVFRKYRFITDVTVPSNIEKFGVSTFIDCTSLMNVNLPDNITNLERNVFYGCYSLDSIKLPSGLTAIDSNMLYYCINLTSVIIPSGVKSIGYYAFYADSKLEKIFYEGTSEEWASISINSDSCISQKAIIYYYSETAPTESGNYWHYVGEVPTIW